jgi:hypothetical protein
MRRRNGIRRGSAVGRAYARCGSNGCSFYRPQSRCLGFIDGLGEGRRGQDQTEGEMGEVAKAEAEGRRVESGVVKRRREDRQML